MPLQGLDHQRMVIEAWGRPETATNNDTDCHEGYYGVRLYRDPRGRFHVGVCIQRMDLCLPLEEFVASSVAGEIRKLRERDYHDLTA